MAVQTVVRSVDQAIVKPLVKRGIGLVKYLGERFFPAQILASQTGPEIRAALTKAGSGLKTRFSTSVDSMADSGALMSCLLLISIIKIPN
jgi:hypothetical protein